MVQSGAHSLLMDELSGLASTLAAGVGDVRGCLILSRTAWSSARSCPTARRRPPGVDPVRRGRGAGARLRAVRDRDLVLRPPRPVRGVRRRRPGRPAGPRDRPHGSAAAVGRGDAGRPFGGRRRARGARRPVLQARTPVTPTGARGARRLRAGDEADLRRRAPPRRARAPGGRQRRRSIDRRTADPADGRPSRPVRRPRGGAPARTTRVVGRGAPGSMPGCGSSRTTGRRRPLLPRASSGGSYRTPMRVPMVRRPWDRRA